MYNKQYEFIVCRYGELSTKGKNRKDFTRQLIKNIKAQCEQFENLEYRPTFDRLYITLNGEDGEAVSKELSKVFGLSSFSLAVKVEKDLDAIADAAYECVKDETDKTFKIIARRNDKSFPHVSDEINRYVAGKILRETELKVNVRNPDIPVLIEVRKDFAYIMTSKIEGAKGHPVGIQGKVMVMLSGGIDSPVAGYLMMKRGVEIECIHFASPPYTSMEAQNKVLELAQKLTDFQHTIRVHIVPFTQMQLAIYKAVPESYAITMMRRMMLRIGEAYALKRRCLALANGENLGQVASQTLHSMNAITSVANMPILRPLLTYDKLEIIDIAQKIDTYETSILPFEDCCTIFTPKNPTTRPRLEKVDFYESKLDPELITNAIEGIETITLKHTVAHEETAFL